MLLSEYLDKKIITRIIKNRDFAALNMTKDDPTVYQSLSAFAGDHGHTRQSLRALELGNAYIDQRGCVYTASHGSLSFKIRGFNR